MVNEEDKEREEAKEEEKVKEERKKDKRNMFRWIGIIVSIFAFVILYFVKRNQPDFPLGWIIIISGLITLFGLGMFFAFNIYDRLRKEPKPFEFDTDKLPPAITKEEARIIAENILRDDLRYLDYPSIIYSEGTEEHGEKVKSQIYSLECQGVYFKGKYFIGINCHFPYQKNRVIKEPSIYQILTAKRMLASFPEEPLPTRTIEEESPLTGVRRKITEVKRKERALKREVKKIEGGIV